MRKYTLIPLIVLVALFTGAGKYKISKVGQPDVYVPTLDSDARTLTVENLIGGGAIPVGAIVPVMPNTDANAWQPPSSGVIKDGFMRADGVTISASHRASGAKFAVGTVLPNMVSKYAKGATTSGTAGGSAYLPAHYHGGGTAANTIGVGGGTSTYSGDASYPSAGHGHKMQWEFTASYYLSSSGLWYSEGGSILDNEPGTLGPSTTSTAGVSSTGASRTGSNTVTGVYGFVGCNGDSSASCANDPVYMSTVWVIRVK